MRFLFLVLVLTPALTAADLSGVDELVERVRKELQVPGAAVGVIHNGKVLLANGYGLRDLERNLPVTADTVFAIGSVTKSFTAGSCASVVEEGKLDWDQPVREYWPWFRLHDPVATELITTRDMLTHRSGLPRHDFIRMSTPLPRQEFLRRLRYLEPSKSFRETFQYNNLMYVAAGFLCADRAGMTWEDLIRKRIFEPLGMTNSTVSVMDSQKLADFAKPHEVTAGSPKETSFYDYQRFGIGPNGAVNSSVNDMLKYLQFYLDGGKASSREIISPRQMRELHQPITVQGDGTYALGWSINYYRGHRRISHGGAITGFTANAALFPEKKIGIVVLNNLGSSNLPGIVTNLVLDRLLGLEPIDHLKNFLEGRNRAGAEASPQPHSDGKVPAKPTLDLSAYAGKYAHPAYGTIEVQSEGEGLKLVFPAWSSAMKHHLYDTFAVTQLREALAQFQLDTKGRVATLLLPLEPAVKPFVFRRQDE